MKAKIYPPPVIHRKKTRKTKTSQGCQPNISLKEIAGHPQEGQRTAYLDYNVNCTGKYILMVYLVIDDDTGEVVQFNAKYINGVLGMASIHKFLSECIYQGPRPNRLISDNGGCDENVLRDMQIPHCIYSPLHFSHPSQKGKLERIVHTIMTQISSIQKRPKRRQHGT